MDKVYELLRQSANVFYNVSQNPALSAREAKVMKELQEAIDEYMRGRR